ncbi:MAG: hypothetical protein QXS02_03580, partial [Candidatus Thermoplasmatota archaeon]
LMMIFSVIMFAALTMFILKSDISINMHDFFFTLFFVFLLKTASDTHKYYIDSPELSYTLSTDTNHTRIISEIILTILSVELLIWLALSGFYLLSAVTIYKINIYYPFEYILFTLGVITATMIGSTLSIYFFSPYRIRLLPSMILLGLYLVTRNIYSVILTIPAALIHLIWSIGNSWSSYLFVSRKKREQESGNAKKRGVIPSLFHKETTTLWRERLLPSFVLTSVITALGSGYMIQNGTDFLPVFMRERLENFLPSLFVFIGVYIIILYTSVFPSLVLFLNEEKTLWILRNMPLNTNTIVHGKASSLLLCFLAATPFIPYISMFIELDTIPYLIWLFIFSYILGIMITLPLSAKYIGKKSDILLLYSISMMLFVLLGSASTMGNHIYQLRHPYNIIILSLTLLLEVITLLLSLKISGKILEVKYRTDKNTK